MVNLYQSPSSHVVPRMCIVNFAIEMPNIHYFHQCLTHDQAISRLLTRPNITRLRLRPRPNLRDRDRGRDLTSEAEARRCMDYTLMIFIICEAVYYVFLSICSIAVNVDYCSSYVFKQ